MIRKKTCKDASNDESWRKERRSRDGAGTTSCELTMIALHGAHAASPVSPHVNRSAEEEEKRGLDLRGMRRPVGVRPVGVPSTPSPSWATESMRDRVAGMRARDVRRPERTTGGAAA